MGRWLSFATTCTGRITPIDLRTMTPLPEIVGVNAAEGNRRGPRRAARLLHELRAVHRNAAATNTLQVGTPIPVGMILSASPSRPIKRLPQLLWNAISRRQTRNIRRECVSRDLEPDHNLRVELRRRHDRDIDDTARNPHLRRRRLLSRYPDIDRCGRHLHERGFHGTDCESKWWAESSNHQDHRRWTGVQARSRVRRQETRHSGKVERRRTFNGNDDSPTLAVRRLETPDFRLGRSC